MKNEFDINTSPANNRNTMLAAVSPSVEEMIFKLKFPNETYDANDYNDWAKENEWEAYKLCLAVSKQRFTLADLKAAYDAGVWNPNGQTADDWIRQVFNSR